jgi:FMN phosphatase YigB (HAD superfamily)
MAVETLLIDFDGVAGHVDVPRVLRRADEFRHWFLCPPATLLRDYFYGNPRNFDLDLGRATVFDVREEIRGRFWSGPSEVWHAWWQSIEDAYEMPRSLQVLLDCLGTRIERVLVTDNHIGFRRWMTGRSDFSLRIDRLVCSAEIGLKKDDRRFFVHAVRGEVSRFASALYVDNSPANVEAARSFGIRSVLAASEPERIARQLLPLLRPGQELLS